jgi:hypothetical protein
VDDFFKIVPAGLAFLASVAANDLRVSPVGDGRTGMTGPQPDHLVRYRDEARSGSNADDDIGCENGFGHATNMHFSANGL